MSVLISGTVLARCSLSEPAVVGESTQEDRLSNKTGADDETDPRDDAESDGGSEGVDDERFPDPPELPDAVKDPSEDGSFAAADYLLDAYEYAYHTADLSAFEKVFGEDCVTCDSLRETFTNNAENDYYSKGARFIDREFNPGIDDEGEEYVIVTTRLKDLVLIGPEGIVQNEKEEIGYRLVMLMEYTDNQWKIIGGSFRESDEVN